eukprot:2611601-Rhodomonas_salina.3
MYLRSLPQGCAKGLHAARVDARWCSEKVPRASRATTTMMRQEDYGIKDASTWSPKTVVGFMGKRLGPDIRIVRVRELCEKFPCSNSMLGLTCMQCSQNCRSNPASAMRASHRDMLIRLTVASEHKAFNDHNFGHVLVAMP